jgi:hypothetical protein
MTPHDPRTGEDGPHLKGICRVTTDREQIRILRMDDPFEFELGLGHILKGQDSTASQILDVDVVVCAVRDHPPNPLHGCHTHTVTYRSSKNKQNLFHSTFSACFVHKVL